MVANTDNNCLGRLKRTNHVEKAVLSIDLFSTETKQRVKGDVLPIGSVVGLLQVGFASKQHLLGNIKQDVVNHVLGDLSFLLLVVSVVLESIVEERG